MCAKIAQNHETKEERVKNPSKVLSSHIFCVPLHSTLSHKTLVAQHRVFFDGKVTQNSVIIAIYKKNIRKSLSFTAQRFFVEKDLIRKFVEVVAVLLTGE